MLERTWVATLARVAVMPAGTVDVSVGGEWSFAQTLRHLILATDMWLGRGGRSGAESGEHLAPVLADEAKSGSSIASN